MGQFSATLNLRKVGSLSSDTVLNPQKDGHWIVVTT